jgi:Holliday junction resolvasome RuvABC DNA-binding subunit
MNNLGLYYQKIEKNYDLMKKYYLMSIELKNSDAMIALGFSKQVAEKSIKSVIDSTQESMTVESIIKKALKDMR